MNSVVTVPRLKAAATSARALPAFSTTFPVFSMASPASFWQVRMNGAALIPMTPNTSIQITARGQGLGGRAAGGGLTGVLSAMRYVLPRVLTDCHGKVGEHRS